MYVRRLKLKSVRAKINLKVYETKIMFTFQVKKRHFFNLITSTRVRYPDAVPPINRKHKKILLSLFCFQGITNKKRGSNKSCGGRKMSLTCIPKSLAVKHVTTMLPMLPGETPSSKLKVRTMGPEPRFFQPSHPRAENTLEIRY